MEHTNENKGKANRRIVPRQSRRDALSNTQTGLGTAAGRSAYSTWADDTGDSLPPGELVGMYLADGMAARIVDLLPDAATSTGFSIAGTDPGFDHEAFAAWVEDLAILGALNDASTWGRLYGGGALIMAGGPLDQPVGPDFVPESLIVTDRQHLSRQPGGRAGDLSRAVHVPEFYQYTRPDGASTGTVHHSRVIAFAGAKTPARIREQNDGWSPSVLVRPYQSITRLAAAMGYAGEMMHTASIVILKIAGLKEMLLTGNNSRAEAQEVVQSIMDSVDQLHAYAVDSADSVEEFTRSFSGVAQMLDHAIADVLRHSEAPKTVFLNEQAGGLAVGSEGEISTWHNVINTWRRKKLTPAVNRIVSGKVAAMGGGESFRVVWDPLSEPDQQAEAVAALTRAQADQIYLTQGVSDPHEIRQREIDAGRLIEVEAPDLPPDPSIESAQMPDLGEAGAELGTGAT